MIKLLLLPLFVFAIPSGIAVGRLIWKRSTIYLAAKNLELEEKRLALQTKRDDFARRLME